MADLLAIVGSCCARPEDSLPVIRQVIERYQPRAIVSGGAIGVDTMAEHVARVEYHLPVIVCRPAAKGWTFYKARDLLIAEVCTRLVRIKSVRTTTYGSGWTRDQAMKMGKPVEEIDVG